MSGIEAFCTNSEITTMGRWGGDGLPASLANHLRQQAIGAREAMRQMPGLRAHVAALEGLADYVGTVDAKDPLWWMLWILSAVQGNPYDFRPGRLQKQLLSQLAQSGPPPLAETTFRELVAAGVNDAANLLWQRAKDAEEGERSAFDEAKSLQDRLDTLTDAETHLKEAHTEIETLTEERDELLRQFDYVREHLGEGFPADDLGPDGDSAPKDSRRTKVEGHTGVYSREDSEGNTIYEIGFFDDQKKQRWRVVGLDLEKAVSLREELAGKPYEPEAVAV